MEVERKGWKMNYQEGLPVPYKVSWILELQLEERNRTLRKCHSEKGPQHVHKLCLANCMQRKNVHYVLNRQQKFLFEESQSMCFGHSLTESAIFAIQD